MPWLKENRFYFYIIILLLLIMALRTPLDTDMWWHLRAGEETWTNRQVYSVDTFSFTRQGQAWLNHSWLSQVIMYLLFIKGNYLALSIWVAVTVVASMALMYFQMDGHPLLRGAVLILAGAAASVVWSPRPQIMSLMFFGLVSYLLYLFKWRKVNYLGWLVPIFLIWSNLHGGYVLGVILVAVMVIGEILNRILPEKNEDSLDWSEIKTLLIWTAVGILAVLVNPFGFGMWKIPFDTVGVVALQDLISEWASPDFHQLFQQPLLWMLFLIFFAIGKSRKAIDGSDLVALIVFGWLAFTSRRNFGPFAMISAPIISRHLLVITEDWKKFKTKAAGKVKALKSASAGKVSDKARNWINLAILLLLILTAGWKAVNVSKTQFVIEQENEIFPVRAVEILQEVGTSGRIINEYNWGGYLIWHLRDYQIFVDGRTDLFGDEIIGEWSEIMNGLSGWDKKLESWEVDYILVSSDWPLRFVIDSEWEVLYSDGNTLLIKTPDDLN